MGKKAKLKEIRRIAPKLPQIQTSQKIGKVLYGHEIPEEEAKKSGIEIEPGKKYKQIQSVPVPVNHEKNMKRLYNKGGRLGVLSYINAVGEYVGKAPIVKQQP